MKVIICGAPHSGKSGLVGALSREGNYLPLFKFQHIDEDYYLNSTKFALGILADYRSELKLALNRYEFSYEYNSTIQTHSLIDSVAYSALKYSLMSQISVYSSLSVINAELTFNTIRAIMRDSFVYDAVFLTKSTDPATDPADEELRDILVQTMDFYNISYTELSGDIQVDVKTIKSAIKSWVDNEQNGDSKQPDG